MTLTAVALVQDRGDVARGHPVDPWRRGRGRRGGGRDRLLCSWLGCRSPAAARLLPPQQAALMTALQAAAATQPGITTACRIINCRVFNPRRVIVCIESAQTWANTENYDLHPLSGLVLCEKWFPDALSEC